MEVSYYFLSGKRSLRIELSGLCCSLVAQEISHCTLCLAGCVFAGYALVFLVLFGYNAEYVDSVKLLPTQTDLLTSVLNDGSKVCSFGGADDELCICKAYIS